MNDLRYPHLGRQFWKGSLHGQITSIYNSRQTNLNKLADFEKAIADGVIKLNRNQLQLHPIDIQKLIAMGLYQHLPAKDITEKQPKPIKTPTQTRRGRPKKGLGTPTPKTQKKPSTAVPTAPAPPRKPIPPEWIAAALESQRKWMARQDAKPPGEIPYEKIPRAKPSRSVGFSITDYTQKNNRENLD